MDEEIQCQNLFLIKAYQRGEKSQLEFKPIYEDFEPRNLIFLDPVK